MGRPRKYKTVDEMQKAIDSYFLEAKKEEEYLTITGLALALGFCTRHALLTYEGYSKEFYVAIKTAKLRIENSYEKGLRDKNVAGSIFALKNFNWHDKQTQVLEIDKNTATLLGLFDGSTKGRLPTEQEVEEAGE